MDLIRFDEDLIDEKHGNRVIAKKKFLTTEKL